LLPLDIRRKRILLVQIFLVRVCRRLALLNYSHHRTWLRLVILVEIFTLSEPLEHREAVDLIHSLFREGLLLMQAHFKEARLVYLLVHIDEFGPIVKLAIILRRRDI